VVCLARQDGGKSNPRVVVNDYMQVIVADAAGFFAQDSGHAISRLVEARQTLDVEVNQITGVLVFVTRHGRWVERTWAIHADATQDALDRSPAELELVRDLPAITELTAKDKTIYNE
jgi:hypothetical protein